MAYNYFPQFYPSMASMMPQQNMAVQQSQNTAQPNNGIIWVQGENAAKSYPVLAGQSVLLMDSEGSVMYIKSTDQSGMPLPLRVFEYTERKSEHSEPQVMAHSVMMDYVPRAEFDQFKDEIMKSLKGTKKPAKRTDEEQEE